jgi:hypothetical protein
MNWKKISTIIDSEIERTRLESEQSKAIDREVIDEMELETDSGNIVESESTDPRLRGLTVTRVPVDIHRETASKVFGVPPEQVTEEQRRAAKTINYGSIYGQANVRDRFLKATEKGTREEVTQAWKDRAEAN